MDGTSLTCLGNVSREIGDFEASRGYLEEAVAVTHEVGSRVGEGIAVMGLGHLLLDVGRADEARSYLERSLALLEAAGDHHSHAFAQVMLAAVAVRQGDLGHARRLFERGLRTCLDLGNRINLALGLEEVAGMLLRERNAGQTVRMLGAAHALREAVHAPVAPSERARIEETIATAREALGEDAFLTEWERGRRSTAEAAIVELFGTK